MNLCQNRASRISVEKILELQNMLLFKQAWGLQNYCHTHGPASLGFQNTIETFQMSYCMMFYLKGHQNCQKSKLKVLKTSPLVSYTCLNLSLLEVLMPLEIKHHTVPHLKDLNSGMDP